MNVIASKGQLRASFMRWSLFTVPLIVLLGYFGGQAGSPDTFWFRSLVKPDIFPPPAAFGIVWTILYVMIGFALALVASAWGAKGRAIALILFAIQLVLNLSWTYAFFGMQSIENGLIVIGTLCGFLIATVIAFWRVRRAAALLMLPYLAWVLFATFLNYEFLRANPDGGMQDRPAETQRIEL
ncbi:TspO/MBR family protein [Altererythrobacter lutimaris]|uniref:Tryptophan-rich sensory protein n=1 Tax=Altererythrobacter lutimaris TaxID=2743979 RepID=A0A850HB35_9SPHN|nr:TspO/MBR family protein [Altererythrobacter lutimaris]NVE94201.1 tryptophan-rich sensory protein [Altererythrobacter lutimaris]